MTSYDHMCGDARLMCLNPSYRMIRNFQSGIVGQDLVSSSSLVANVRHLTTGFISPQYHMVFDDLFESVFISGPNDAIVDAICKDLYRSSCEVYATEEYDGHDNLVYKPPPLDEVWLDAEGREQRKLEL